MRWQPNGLDPSAFIVYIGDMKQYHIKPGEKYHRLTAIEFDHIGEHNRSYFLFLCDCGNKKIILGSGVVSGNTKSCGCLARDSKALRRLPDNQSEITAIILGYKRHAEGRGFAWNLSEEFVSKIIRMNCYYCEALPSNRKKTKNSLHGGLLYSGIDRVDSSAGYTEDNVVPCCKICNYAKSNMHQDDFRKWALRIGKNAMAAQWGKV